MMLSEVLLPLRVLACQCRLERSCRWTKSELEAHRRRSLERLRRAAYLRSPFYQRFHKGKEDRPMDELPILTKPTLMEHFDDLVTDRAIRLSDVEKHLNLIPRPALFRGRYVVLATSGSTGRRGIFLFSQSEWLLALASITRPMAWAGVRHNPLRPKRVAVVASTLDWHYSARIGRSLSSRFAPSLRIDATQPLPEIVQSLNTWQPEVMAVYPSLLRQLADEQLAGRLNVALRSIGTSAEVLTDQTRHRAEQAWGIRVFDTYGATEYAPIAAECPRGRRHLVEDTALIEIVDERGRRVPDGVDGDRVLLTVFDRFTQPLIRYEISDMVHPIAGACECGRPFRLIDRIGGRLEEILEFASAEGAHEPVRVHPNVFHEVLETVPATGWQVVQDDDGLHVRLLGLDDRVSPQHLERALHARLAACGVAVPALAVEPVAALERGATGKAPLIACRLKGRPERVTRA